MGFHSHQILTGNSVDFTRTVTQSSGLFIPMFDKHLLPNIVAVLVILLGLSLSGPVADVVLSVGLFALSGSLTNWLAIHMLFERVPGLYGSGVILLQFDEFKRGILRLVHEQLFRREKVDEILRGDAEAASGSGRQSEPSPARAFNLEPLLAQIDLDLAFDQLVMTIKESSFGGMLGMIGGEAALQPLREPFRQRMQKFLTDAARSPRLQAAVQQQIARAATSDRFLQRLDTVLRARLDELTPEMVRDIMQQMIRRHLGWLVVWGGVFGGLIGLLAGLLQL